MDDAVLQIQGLTKRFSGQVAVNDVSLELRPGEIRGLVGENGAGKSTLIKCLAGVYTPDEGQMLVNGAPLSTHPEHAIAFVHQDLGLVDDLTVGENIALTSGFKRRGPLIDWRGVWEDAKAAYESIGLTPPDPRMEVKHLSAAEKALLGVVRALSTHAAVVVLDEPTASLPVPDVKFLLGALRDLKALGTPILYVTHRLQELYEVVDSITVLRGGRKVAEGPISEFSVDDIVEAMLGRRLAAEAAAVVHRASGGEPLVVVRDLHVGHGSYNFEVREGEILGLAGLRGAGQDRIGRALSGALEGATGQVSIHQDALPRKGSTSQRMGKGVALLPADRQRESTVPGMTLRENLYPGPHNRSGSLWWISPRRERARALELLQRYNVNRLDPEFPINQLSGGNQQKVVVARILSHDNRLVILEEPTAGVDVGSKFEIHEFVRKAAADGVAVVVVSSDFEEIAQLCTRVLIVIDGAIEGEVQGADISADRLAVLCASKASAVAQPTHSQRGESADTFPKGEN